MEKKKKEALLFSIDESLYCINFLLNDSIFTSSI